MLKFKFGPLDLALVGPRLLNCFVFQYIFISPQTSVFKNKAKKNVNVIEIEKGI